jgi:uncharacterized cupredoxin-like copper-binding protein
VTRLTRLVLAAPLLLGACGGDAKEAPARTIEVKALDTLRFDPPNVAAKAGERVTFRVTNTGATDHEFVVGDAAFQAAHETGGHAGHAGGAAVSLKPGETKTLDYTMPETAPAYACHVAGHDDAGMKGTVTYTVAF